LAHAWCQTRQTHARLLVVSNKTELQEFCKEVGCDFMLFPQLSETASGEVFFCINWHQKQSNMGAQATRTEV
jgi:hypothetical protein